MSSSRKIQKEISQPKFSQESTNVLSQIPTGAAKDLQIQCLIAYCCHLTEEVNKLKEHIKKLDKELDRDAEAKAELDEIYKKEKLQRYYHKLCELSYYFLASKAIASQMVEHAEDMHAWTVRMASEAAESLLLFIPVISGFSGLIKAGEEAHKIIHNIASHRRAVNIANWTNGLGENADERLARRFARKLTLKKAEEILHPSLKQHPKKDFVDNLSISQFRRETKENYQYTPEERLALADIVQILEVIGNNKLKPLVSGSEEEKMAARLRAMLAVMKVNNIPKDSISLIRSPTFYNIIRRDFSKYPVSLISKQNCP